MKLEMTRPGESTLSEIKAMVLQARQQEENEGMAISHPETRRMVAYWKEYRPKMWKRLAAVSPDAPLCLASRMWESANKQATLAAGRNQYPTYGEAMEVLSREMFLMEPEEEDGSVEPEETPLDQT